MSMVERAIYLDLLFQIWERGGAIPADHVKLAKMALATPAEFAEAWPAVSKHLVPHPDEAGMLTNLKMLDVIGKQASDYAAHAKNGRLGGIAKARNRGASETASETGSETASGRLAKSYQLEVETEVEEEEIKPNTCASKTEAPVGSLFPIPQNEKKADPRLAWFDEFWTAYKSIRSRAKKDALKAFLQVVKTESAFRAVMAALDKQTPEMLSREPEHRPYPGTYLRGRRFEDEAAEVAPVKLDAAAEAMNRVYSEMAHKGKI